MMSMHCLPRSRGSHYGHSSTRLQQDHLLPNRTSISIPQIITPFPFFYGSGLWMRHLSSNRQNNVTNSSSTSIPIHIHIHIQFTMKDPSEDGTLSFLYTLISLTLPFLYNLISLSAKNTPITSVYRKPTHTNQYLQWDSNHFILAKYSVYKTLAN